MTPHQLSRRCGAVVQSEIRTMSIECEKAGGINLAQGVCDTEVPAPVRQGAHQGIEGGVNAYTRFDGIDELRQAIAKKLSDFNGIQADPDTQVTVSGGSTGAFYCACLALLNPGDEVILFEPYYGYHVITLLAVDAVPKYVRLSPPNWTFSMDELEQAVTPKTRGIMINTPANPSGKVFTREELEMLAGFVVAHNLVVFTDEIYEYFLYDGLPHVSPGSIERIKHRTVTISGFSKTFSVTGWRIGYSVAAPEVARMIGYMSDLVYVCAPAPLQVGVARGMSQLPQDFFNHLALEYKKKRDQICQVLERIGLTPYVPRGAYYVLADVSKLPGASSKEKAMHLLAKTGVASVPGEAFYHDDAGKNLVRFCYAKTDTDLHQACQRLLKLNS